MARPIALSHEPPGHRLLAGGILLLLGSFLLWGCAHAPPAAIVGTGAAPPAAFSGSPQGGLPSDVASVPPHTGTIVYEALQPDPSNMPRDIVLILYADRRALLLDRVVGDPALAVAQWEGSWSLSDAGSVRLFLEGKGGEIQLLLKREEGFLTGDGTRFGGGVMLLREI